MTSFDNYSFKNLTWLSQDLVRMRFLETYKEKYDKLDKLLEEYDIGKAENKPDVMKAMKEKKLA